MTWAERWEMIMRFLPDLVEGTLMTLELVGIAVVVGLILSLIHI